MWEEPWREIAVEPPPKNRVVLLFAETEAGDNWRLETGWWSTAYEGDEEFQPWKWGGEQLRHYQQAPTHWMPLPVPPWVDDFEDDDR